MAESHIAQLGLAERNLVALIRTTPDVALDWRPDADSWSPKRIVAHVAHAYDFYIMIVEEARAASFGAVTLHPDLPGWQRLVATDGAALRCADVASLLDVLASAVDRASLVFGSITQDELDRPFVLVPWKPGEEQETAALRARVLAMVTSHLREHQLQVEDTLHRWRLAQ